MQYLRFCRTLSDKGQLIPITEDVYKIITPDKDYYKSIYYYNEDQKNKFYAKILDENGRETIAGCSGIEDVLTNKLVFDFDSDNDLEAAKSDAIELCTRLIKAEVPQNSLQICFSGNKGFGIEIETEGQFSPQQFKNIVFALAGDLKTFDRTINNASRIMRIPMTRHPKSKLFKYPLTLDELTGLTMTDIKAMATNNNIDIRELKESGFWGTIKVPMVIDNMRNVTPEKRKERVDNIKATNEIDISEKPSWLTKCKYAISLGFFDSGIRHYSFLMLAANYKKQGFPRESIYRLLKSTADLQSQRTGQERYADRELWRHANDVCKLDWKGGTFTCREEGWLKEYCTEHGFKCFEDDIDKKLVRIDDVFDKFRNYAENIDANIISTGIRELDKRLRITTSMLVGVLGAPSSGKTSLAMNIIGEVNKIGEKSAFYSLDMAEPLIYQKLAQKYTGYSSNNLFEIFSTTEKKINRMVATGLIDHNKAAELRKKLPEYKQKIQHINTQISENFKNVRLCFKAGLTVEDIRQDLINYERTTGDKLKLVVIDYLECIQGPYSDSTANTSLIAQKLKDVANELDVCVLLLLQPPKIAGDPSDPLISYRSIKGSSAIEQACSVVLSLWREGFNPQDQELDRFITLSVLKNRMGVLSTVDCSWDGLTGAIAPLDENEMLDLNNLRENARARRPKKDDEF